MNSTRKLVDSVGEQLVLERLLDESKPPIPSPCESLDYLLYTPFRYPTRSGGSRFRGVTDPGVFYGADEIRTACAELGFHRTRFLRDSDGLKRLDAVPHTLFLTRAAGSTIDLRMPPFENDRRCWTDPDVAHYDKCQAFARVARQAGVTVVRYESVRDPEPGACTAVLECSAFAGGRILERQTWFLTAEETTVSWVRAGDKPRAGSVLEFSFA